MRKLDAVEKFMICWMVCLLLVFLTTFAGQKVQEYRYGYKCGYRVAKENFTSERFDTLDMGGFDEWFDSGYWITSSFWYEQGYEEGFKKSARDYWWY
ncbi:MAG: hypothetical protein KKH94_11485 [Candidatus Omnitrophica bacterium]|nr:hypothetical protein [Candidatus Omnitrophota bacterium]